jgi:hypothetical protein
MRYFLLLLAIIPFAAPAQRTDNTIIWKCKGPACLPHPITIYKEPIEPVVYLTCINSGSCCQVLEEIVELPILYLDVTDLVPVAPAVYQRQRGAPIIMNGGRPGEVLYVIDEMRVQPGQTIRPL